MSRPKIAIINYGVGNLRSASKGLERAGADSLITADIADALSYDAVVFPGVGAFGSAMQIISKHGQKIEEAARQETPFLGICLGMQILFSESEESKAEKGLDIIPGKVKRLPNSVKVPQMGWNTLKIIRDNPIIQGISKESYFYFVHSYICKPQNTNVIIATTNYGSEFPSIVAKGNAYGTQFHPEKSGACGLKILENFVNIARRVS